MNEPLSLNIRKVLCCRCIIWRAIAPHRLNIIHANAEPTWRALEQGLIEITNMGLLSPPSISLDEFLIQSFLPACRALPQWTGPNTVLLSPLLKETETEIQKVICRKCSPLVSQICCDGEFDEQIVSTGGHCLRTLNEIFKLALSNTKLAYQQFASSYPNTVQHDIELQFKNQSEKPHKFPNQYWISAVTTYRDTPAHLASEILVKLSVENFDIDTFLACFYVFMHECVCHVFQGLMTTGRTTTEPYDRFAEGWMDFLTILLVSWPSIANTMPGFVSADCEQERIGTDYHNTRLNYQHRDRVKEAVCWAHGRQAAQKVLDLFSRLPETHTAAEETFLKFSFDLNLYSFESHNRELLVGQIDKYLPLRGSLPGSRYPEFVDIIRKYLMTKDLRRMAEDIIKFG